MKTFSKEKLILEHYVKTAEEVMDEVTVRVWKPKTMQKLPAVCMRIGVPVILTMDIGMHRLYIVQIGSR